MPMTNRADLTSEWDGPNPDQDADEIRQRDYQDLIAKIQEFHGCDGYCFGNTLDELSCAWHARRWNPYGPGRLAHFFIAYAQIYDWPATLRAIAAAIQAEQQERSQ